LPFVAITDDAPGFAVVFHFGHGDFFGLQFISAEGASQTDVISDAHRFIEALRPLGNDLLDLSPSGDGLHEDPLVFMKLRLCHDFSQASPGPTWPPTSNSMPMIKLAPC